MPTPTAPIDDRAPAAPSPPAPLALVREVQEPGGDRGRVAGLAMVCSAAGVALGFALAGSLFAAMAPPPRTAVGPAGWSHCSGDRSRRSHGLVEPQLIAQGPRPWLGITVDVGKKPAPAVLTGVFSGAPAAEAGLRPGNRVIRFDGRSVETATELLGLIGAHQPGDLVNVEVQRSDGGRLSIRGLRLSTMPVPVR